MQESESKAEAPKEEEAAPAAAAPGESSFLSFPNPTLLYASLPSQATLLTFLVLLPFSLSSRRRGIDTSRSSFSLLLSLAFVSFPPPV